MLNAALALVPVSVFLGGLVLLDSFKLVPLQAVLRLILAGAFAAFVAARLHGGLLDGEFVSGVTLSRHVAPVTEELFKALPLLYLLARRRVGFLVDAAILGFAVGTGFALVENVEYLRALGKGSVFLWIVRGFGTAVLHGATTSILAVVAKGLEDRHPRGGIAVALPGLAVAVAILPLQPLHPAPRAGDAASVRDAAGSPRRRLFEEREGHAGMARRRIRLGGGPAPDHARTGRLPDARRPVPPLAEVALRGPGRGRHDVPAARPPGALDPCEGDPDGAGSRAPDRGWRGRQGEPAGAALPRAHDRTDGPAGPATDAPDLEPAPLADLHARDRGRRRVRPGGAGLNVGSASRPTFRGRCCN
ncbi:MAG: PrsW family intramembrane metalloprotease [Holophagales bacterium]|nr:PrsW family intramembrane metalloprotease [Holophagales bacterium]